MPTTKPAAHLTDAELLARLTRASTSKCAQSLAAYDGNLAAMLAAAEQDAAAIIGAAQLAAANELTRRSLAQQMKGRDCLSSPAAVRSYLRLRLAALPHEEFHVVFLDAQNRVIAHEAMFRGTLTQTSVYPREVVKAALRHNAAGAILAHNHPSGVAEPSIQDQALTAVLSESLALVDCKVLDHFIVAPGSVLSFAERGLM